MRTYNFFAELCKIMWWRLEQIKGGGSSRLVFEMYDEQIEDLAIKITNEILSHNRNNMIFLRNKLSDREATRCIDVLAVKIPREAKE